MSSMNCTERPQRKALQHSRSLNRKEDSKMNTATILAVIAIAAILFFAVRYLYKEKKKGNHCVGCPYADSCPKHRQGTNCGQ